MDTKIFEDYQKQVADWQKKFFDTWMESMPSGKIDFQENFEKTLKFQEEAVKNYLEAQEKASKMMLDSQKEFWKNYFEAMRKAPAANLN